MLAQHFVSAIHKRFPTESIPASVTPLRMNGATVAPPRPIPPARPQAAATPRYLHASKHS